MDKEEIVPIKGEFSLEANLMWQLELLTDEQSAKKWYKEYLQYHNGVDQGVMYVIGYFANIKHRDNLNKWFKEITGYQLIKEKI